MSEGDNFIPPELGLRALGEAQETLNSHTLRMLDYQEFYGLPARPPTRRQRLTRWWTRKTWNARRAIAMRIFYFED